MMDGGPTPFMVAQAMDIPQLEMPSMGLDAGQDDLMPMDPAWMADINDMDWVSYRVDRLSPLKSIFLLIMSP